MVTLSAVLHLGIGVTAGVLPGMLPRARGPVWDDVIPGLVVDSLPAELQAPPAGGPEPEPQAAAPAPEPEPEPPPPPPEPEKKPPKKKDPPPPAPEKKPEKKPEPQPAPRPTSPSPDAGTGTATETAPASGAAGVADAGDAEAGIGLSFGGARFGYAYYTTQIINILKANWQRPVHPGTDDAPLSVRVRFRIHRDGSTSGARIETPSPFTRLDDSALRAVYAARRFPPLPPQYTEDTLDVAITFTLEPDGI